MAVCVISAVDQPGHGTGTVVPACMVHIQLAPCQHNGEPAHPAPIHLACWCTPEVLTPNQLAGDSR